jgi:hypothetical protein
MEGLRDHESFQSGRLILGAKIQTWNVLNKEEEQCLVDFYLMGFKLKVK